MEVNSKESETPNSNQSEHAKDVEKGTADDAVDSGRQGSGSQLKSAPGGIQQHYTDDGKRIITEHERWDALGYSSPSWKKWMLLSSVFAVQVSMNSNTSVYPAAVIPLSEYWHITEQVARIPAALAPNFGTIIAARALGGLSSAGGSVTLGMVADLWEAEEQQWAIAFVVLSSVGGTSVGPIAGGPIAKYLSWRWNFWIQLIFGAVVQAVHFFMPESRSTILMDREAKRRRKTGEDPNVYGPNEVKNPRESLKEFSVTWIRPFEMFVEEPIVLSMSLLSGFSDALIFTFLEGFPLVYKQWGFGTLEQAWTFIPIIIGYLIAYISYFPWIASDRRAIKKGGPDAIPPERRLYWLLYLAPLETIGLFGFAWTSLGPPRVHWIAPMIFSTLVAIANYAIYMSTIDYMVAAYGIYSASATGGNGLARDFLAGVAAMYATPFYENIDSSGLHLEYTSTILGCTAFLVTIPIYICYWKGPWIRQRSKFAMSLDADRRENQGRRISAAPAEQLEPKNL